jgi:hypothetical protein
MEDNLAVLPRERETGPSRLRNIDPSMLRESTVDGQLQHGFHNVGTAHR